MATVTVDLIEGASATYTADGWKLTRVVLVRGLTGDDEDRMMDAVTVAIGTVGNIGAVHPGRTRLRIVEFTPETVDSCNDVRVKVVYEDLKTTNDDEANAKVTIGTSLSQVETNKDKDDTAISVSYTYPSGYSLDPNKAGQTVTQGGMVPKRVPGTTISFELSSTTSPGIQSRAYVGKVNQAGWSVDPTSPAGVWMCASITGYSNDGGINWTVTKTFEYRDNTWKETAVFINPDDGKPPADLGAAGKDEVDIYDAVDFDILIDWS